MKELRSVVNACFCFLVFLLVLALFRPGHTSGSARGPRFLRMEVSETRHGRAEKVSFSVPFFFVSGAARFASLGNVERELDLHMDRSVEHEELKALWEQLKSVPEGTEVEQEHDGDKIKAKKEGKIVTVRITEEHDGSTSDRVTLRVPLSLVEAAVDEDRDLDVEAIIAELRSATRGDLVDVESRDAHVRIWVE